MDPFVSAKTLLNRAHQHITEFDAWLLAYRNQNPYQFFSEHDEVTGKTIHKARITAQPPLILPGIVFDVVSSLRSALDHAVFDSSSVLGGSPKPKSTKFPFGKTGEEAANDLLRKRSEVPDVIRPYLLSFRPYPESEGGNGLLDGLNELRNGKIHRTLAPIVHDGGSTGVNLLNSGVGDFAVRSDWDPTKQEYTFLEIGGANEIALDVSINVDIALGDGTPFPGKNASALLKEMLTLTATIVYGIEAETTRLKASPTSNDNISSAASEVAKLRGL